MFAAVADTHTAIWFLDGDSRLSITAEQTIRAAATAGLKVAVSAVTLIEIVYLVDKGRIPAHIYTDVRSALADPSHVFHEIAIDAEVAEAMRMVSRAEVPDMPDRIVAATGLFLEVPIISRDGKIRSSSVSTIW